MREQLVGVECVANPHHMRGVTHAETWRKTANVVDCALGNALMWGFGGWNREAWEPVVLTPLDDEDPHYWDNADYMERVDEAYARSLTRELVAYYGRSGVSLANDEGASYMHPWKRGLDFAHPYVPSSWWKGDGKS